MSTKTKYFSSAMVGSPVLNGVIGSLIPVLDACLVTGFGLKSVDSLVVAGGVATMNFGAGHSFAPDCVALIEGVSPVALAGEKRIITTTTNTATFDATGVSDQTATGSITAKVAPAGFEKIFSSTNNAAYKSKSIESSGCILRVADTGTKNAYIVGYEAMSDVDTGVGRFPSITQFAAEGLYVSKSNTADAVSRRWHIFADDRAFYFFTHHVLATDYECQNFFFGDINSIKSNDPYACVIRCSTSDTTGQASNTISDMSYSNGDFGVPTHSFAARAATGLGGSQIVANVAEASSGMPRSGVFGNNTGFVYPSPVTNGLMLARVCVMNITEGLRGYFPGIMLAPQYVSTTFSTGDVVTGTGTMVGKSLKVVKNGNNQAPTQGVNFIAHTADWRE